MKHLVATFAVIAALGLNTPPLMADHGDNGNKHQQGNKHGDNDQGWEHRGGYEYRTYSEDSHPPGWNRGKKTGWGDCGLPPGQAKKYGCRMYTYEGRPYYYYQDNEGRFIVRRPTIEVHGSVDIVH
jgi:hypothetical protein